MRQLTRVVAVMETIKPVKAKRIQYRDKKKKTARTH